MCTGGLLTQLARLLAPGAPMAAAGPVLAVARAGVGRQRLPEIVREAVEAGLSEAAAARVAGVSRQTVRAWLKP